LPRKFGADASGSPRDQRVATIKFHFTIEGGLPAATLNRLAGAHPAEIAARVSSTHANVRAANRQVEDFRVEHVQDV
jgi:hypothetical protein